MSSSSSSSAISCRAGTTSEPSVKLRGPWGRDFMIYNIFYIILRGAYITLYRVTEGKPSPSSRYIRPSDSSCRIIHTLNGVYALLNNTRGGGGRRRASRNYKTEEATSGRVPTPPPPPVTVRPSILYNDV